jgi:hypothetical protein
MENELMKLNMEQIIVRQGYVEFLQFDDLKKQALDLAANMETVEVNEETIKDSKKLLAAVNKRVKELEDRRIRIKKLMLEPYDIFEAQVKEIVRIVKEADETLRQQVRDLEELDRLHKRTQLENIFNKRKVLYTLGDLIDFEDFMEPKHLNKSQSIESTETEMIDFLERTENDVKVMQRLPDVQAHLNAYLGSFNLALAMTQVNQEKERRERIEASQAVSKNETAMITKTFTVYDEKDFLLVELYMKNNRIKFTVKEGL